MGATLKLRNPQVARLHAAAVRSGKRRISRDERLRLEARRKVRARLNAKLKAIAAQTKRAQRAVTRICQTARKRARARAQEERAAASAKREKDFGRVKVRCADRRQKIRAAQRTATAAALLAAEHEKRLWDEVYGKGTRKRAGSIRKSERRQESDEEVERNIETELVPVWKKVRRRISGSQYQSRLEAFRHWVHDNESEVRAMLAEFESRAIERAQREWAKEQVRWEREQHAAQLDALARKYERRGLSKQQARKQARHDLTSDVPF